MKQFLRKTLFTLFAAGLVIAFSIPFAFTSAAAENVIFISDAGIGKGGDGSSASKPFDVTDSQITENYTYIYNSLLYQAALKLAHTGGTIVVCGDVKIDAGDCNGDSATDRGFYFPHHPESITITSVYNGVDYRKTNGADFIIQTPAQIMSEGPLVFDNINICTKGPANSTTSYGTNRLICANGYPLTMGEGVSCTPLNNDGTVKESPENKDYPEIFGGDRYRAVDHPNTCIINVNGGTWNRVCGGTRGFSTSYADDTTLGHMYGEIHLTIGSKAIVKDSVYATTYQPAPMQFGDVYVTVNKGANIGGSIHFGASSTAGGFGAYGYNVYYKINGGTIASVIDGRPTSLVASSLPRYMPTKTILDLTDCAANLAKYIVNNKLRDLDVVILSPEIMTSASLKTSPTSKTYTEGDRFEPSGMVINQVAEGKTFPLPYSEDNKNFRFEPEVLNAGQNSVEMYYGNLRIDTITVNAEPRPRLQMMGAQVKTSGEKQSLRFIAHAEGTPEGFTLIENGIVIQPTEYFSEKSMDMPGAKIAKKNTLTTYAGGYLFSGEVSDIPIEEYTVPYTAFAYLIYTYNGKEYTVYSDTIERSVKSVADAACASGSIEPAAKKTKLTQNIIKAVTEGRTSAYDQSVVDTKVRNMLSKMKSMSSVTWVAGADIDFTADSSFTSGLTYKKGETYVGLPYVAGNNSYIGYEQWLDYCPNGSTYTGPTGWDTMLGVQCSAAVTRAFQIVANSDRYPKNYSILESIPHEGHSYYAKVGDYVIPDGYMLTSAICEYNGNQAIYESYADTREGDFIVASWITNGERLGHIRIVNKTEIKRNSNGTIDGANSYLYTSEQCSTMTDNTTWRINYKYKFSSLAGTYIPIRLTAFDTGYFETPHITVFDKNTPENFLSDGLSGYIKANYDIYTIRFSIYNEDGTRRIYEKAYPNKKTYFDLKLLDKENDLPGILEPGKYRYELKVSYANSTHVLCSFDFVKS